MKFKKNWVIPAILAAAAGLLTLQNGTAPVESPSAASPTPTYAGCSYMWASQDAPELTETISAAVSEINPQASARASLYGENCVYADGHADFHVMETDFYISLPVDDLTKQEDMGNWAAQIMSLVLKIPRETIKGNEGFVEFWFEDNDAERVVVRIPIQKYKDEAQGKSGSALYEMFAPIPQ